ncbi:MAG TPA: DUF4412 domain-containing protein [Myxococcaceae bacterium]|nr:DUF4412 domain-containing protein [Myxococcaceae bacterium]
MIRALAAALCLAAVPALAFEGVIETKMSMSRGKADSSGMHQSMNGAGTISIKGLNSRMEQQMNVPGMTTPMKTVVIHRADEHITYILQESSKTYSKHADEKSDRDESEASKWTVKKLGRDTVAGRSTEHVQLTHQGRGDAMEVWVDKNLVSAGDLEKAFSGGDRGGGGGWFQALRKEGVAGVPLKVIANSSKGEGGMTFEATSVKAQSVPDSAFKVPAGYTESKGYGGMTAPGDAQQRREQMLQQLSPEQRKQVEEMMKQHGGGQN